MLYPHSSLWTGIAHRYSNSLWAGRFRDRILVGARFSAPVHTGPGAHPASYTMGTGSFPGVKWLGGDVEHPPQSSAEVKERVELYLCFPSGPSLPVLGWNLPYFTVLPWGFPGLHAHTSYENIPKECCGKLCFMCLMSQTQEIGLIVLLHLTNGIAVWQT